MKTTTKRQLLKHSTVARMFDVSPKTIKAWVARGVFPEPHSIQQLHPDDDKGAIYFFEESVILYRLEHRLWPEGTEFRRPCS